MIFADAIATEISNQWNVHDKYKNKTLEQLKEICSKDRLEFGVLLLNSTGDLNIGATIRSAHLLGASFVIVFGRRKYDGRSTVGAEQYISVSRIDGLRDDGSINTQKFWEVVTDAALYPIFVENGGIHLSEFPWEGYVREAKRQTTIPCLIFGNESVGIPNELLHGVDPIGLPYPIIAIPQLGVLRSFNLSNAASIVMWEMKKELNKFRR